MTDIQKMYIGGEWVESISGELLEVRNPATGEVVGRAAFGDDRDALRAIDAAHAAFPAWSRSLARERSRYLYRLYELVFQHRNELAELVSAEMGKPIREAKGEVVGSADYFLWYAEEAKRVYGETIPSSFANKRILVHRQPVGVVAAITPWNFPVNMVARKIAPALAAGCTVVLKPAEATPLSAIRLFELIHEAGFPPGVANLVIGQPEKVGEAFLKSPKVAKIAFTGSTRVGKLLMAGAAEHVKRVSLELGGHAPTLVFADADLDLAVKGVFESKFRNTGQMCICTNRLYVERSVAEPFVERLVERVRRAKVGDGRDPEVEVGPIINERGLEKVLGHIEDARAKGAAVVCGGKRLTEGDYAKGYFVEPTVLTGVERGMRVLEEETFGPVLPVAVFDTEDEAIRLANDSPYGLAAYLYTRDLGRAVRVAEALEFGIVGVNDGAPVQTQAPFGGFKESGLGREGGHHAMDEFLEIKHISLAW